MDMTFICFDTADQQTLLAADLESFEETLPQGFVETRSDTC